MNRITLCSKNILHGEACFFSGAIISRFSQLLASALVWTVFCLTNPVIAAETHQLKGRASWYGTTAHGKKTANGEIFNRHALSAAHPTLPFGTVVRVYNQRNGRHTLVRVNDRGPFAKNRVIDLSRRAGEILRMIKAGISPVVVEIVSDNKGRPAVSENSFFLHLATEENRHRAGIVSSMLASRTGLPMRTFFSADLPRAAYIVCSGPYDTFLKAQEDFLKVEKYRPAFGIIEAPTTGKDIPRHISPARRGKKRAAAEPLFLLWDRESV